MREVNGAVASSALWRTTMHAPVSDTASSAFRQSSEPSRAAKIHGVDSLCNRWGALRNPRHGREQRTGAVHGRRMGSPHLSCARARRLQAAGGEQ